MKYHTDHHFIIGHGHAVDGKPCQDHALSGITDTVSPGCGFLVVSDGCSSGLQTDVGSRLVTTTSVRALRAYQGITALDGIDETVHEYVSGCSRILVTSAAYDLGLSSRDLLATQLFAYATPTGDISVSVFGDGLVAFVLKSGRIRVHKFEWANNLPFYVHEDRERFLKFQGGLEERGLSETIYEFDDTTEVPDTTTLHIQNKDGCAGINLLVNAETDDIALVALLSDGVLQVDKMNELEVLRSLLGFKNLTGFFVKRRLIRFLESSKKIGSGPFDDLSLAVMVVDPE